MLVMNGHSHEKERTMRYDGTRATLRGQYYPNEQEIQVHDHRTGKVEFIRPTLGPIGATGHGGGDTGLMAGFVRAVRDHALALTTAGSPVSEATLTTGRESLESHLMAFAAEEARVNETTVYMDEFRRQSEASG